MNESRRAYLTNKVPRLKEKMQRDVDVTRIQKVSAFAEETLRKFAIDFEQYDIADIWLHSSKASNGSLLHCVELLHKHHRMTDSPFFPEKIGIFLIVALGSSNGPEVLTLDFTGWFEEASPA